MLDVNYMNLRGPLFTQAKGNIELGLRLLSLNIVWEVRSTINPIHQARPTRACFLHRLCSYSLIQSLEIVLDIDIISSSHSQCIQQLHNHRLKLHTQSQGIQSISQLSRS